MVEVLRAGEPGVEPAAADQLAVIAFLDHAPKDFGPSPEAAE